MKRFVNRNLQRVYSLLDQRTKNKHIRETATRTNQFLSTKTKQSFTMKKQRILVASLSLKCLGVLIRNGMISDKVAQQVFNLIFPLLHADRTPVTLKRSVLKTVYNNSSKQI